MNDIRAEHKPGKNEPSLRDREEYNFTNGIICSAEFFGGCIDTTIERGTTMKNERTYLKCEICGNIIGMIEDSGVSMVCCGQDMTLLTPNTVDVAQEKHIPVAKWEDGKLVVTIGSTAHPMTAEHHIAWIAVAQGKMTQRVTLDHTGAPSAIFLMDKAPVTIYAYCNLHGLWAAEA